MNLQPIHYWIYITDKRVKYEAQTQRLRPNYMYYRQDDKMGELMGWIYPSFYLGVF